MTKNISTQPFAVQEFPREAGSALPMVSIITPAYNEEAILAKNLQRLCDYMQGLEASYRWEILVVNDGSKDQTGKIADDFADTHPQVRVIHHQVNRNLGGALRTGFAQVQGDLVIVMDLDLSYGPEHIERLLAEQQATDADIVVASPYMKGGKNTAVPKFRLILSKAVNYIMRLMAPCDLHTFTSMVRVYKREFLQTLNLKSNTYSINPEIIHKAIILRARIIEIPAHLDWSFQQEVGLARTSSIRIFKGILAGLMSGFIFRPYAFFMSIGSMLMAIALYVVVWIFINTFAAYPEIPDTILGAESRFGEAVAIVYRERPYSFLVGGITLIIALQFLSMGFLSLQNKRYFDELFHINTTLLKQKNNKQSLEETE